MYKRPRGELAVLTLRESWREHIRLLPRWTGHRGACQISLSLIYMRERERETHIYCCYRGSQRGVSAVQQRRREVLPRCGSDASKTAWGASARNSNYLNFSTVVQQRISLIYTTNNEKNLAPKVCSKKHFQKHIVAGFRRRFRRICTYIRIIPNIWEVLPRSCSLSLLQ